MPIEIDDTEYKEAVKCGKRRLDYILEHGLKQRGGVPGENEDMKAMIAQSILGAAGEIAYGKKAGHKWECKPETFGKGDDVGGTQVRTGSGAKYRLIVRPGVDDVQHAGQPFVLLTGPYGGRDFVAVGWIWCEEAQRDEWLDTPRGGKPAWFVPQSALHPFPVGSREHTTVGDVRAEDVCPKCGSLGFRRSTLSGPTGTTELLICAQGCTGRSIAVALSLENWP